MSICYDVCIHFIGCVWENNEPKERQKAMNRKIWKALGIAVCMLALAAPRAMAARYEVGMDDPFIKFGDAVEAINQSGDTENEIVLMENITLGGNYINYTLTNDKTTTTKTTTIKGEGHTISIESKAEIKVEGEKTVLNLGANGYDKKLTIDGDTTAAFIVVSGGATANMNENVTLQNRMFTGNAYVLVTGSKSVFNMNGGVIEGGSRAVIAQSGATFYMRSGEIKNCKVNGDGVISVTDNSKFIMEGGTISGCKAGAGGGLYAKNKSTITINKGTISGCTADNGGGLYADNSTVTISGGTISGCKALSSDKGNGGGLYVEGSTVNISGGTISECTARNNGGGLYATNSSTNSSIVTISGGTISGCKGLLGGGLYADNSAITISGGTISGCTTSYTGNGGGLYVNNSTIEISDGTIKGNEATFSGGGLYVDGSTVTISGGAISECTAAIKEGGGLYATNSSEIIISGGTISGCKAPSSDKGNGSGLYANHSTIKITGGTISGCEGRWGGGLYAENSSTIEISGGTISRCKVGAGGGLFVVGSTIRISGGIISECTTSDTGNGGGLYAKDSTIKITGGRIENNKAALGGGVALIGKTTFEKPITNWTVIGNEAYATGGVGGGIKLENGSMDVSAGSNRIYNNTADGHGADICLEGGASSIKLPNAANMGATYRDSGINIDGWYEDNPPYMPSKDGVAVDISKTLTGPRSLVASYKADPVHIEIDTNGGAGGSGSQTVQKGTNVTLEAPTREGYLFTGWEDENKKSYPAGEDGKVNITVNENMKLTAVWEARTFTVTYVLLNGETRAETVNYGETVTLGEEPRTGYTFVGWKDGENVYHAGETITVTEDKTLTAVWEARSFTVTYVLLNGETRAETVNYGETVTLGEEPRTGYTFVGWNDGENVHRAGETITVTGDMTLTAVWKARTFTVTYVLLNGETRTETVNYGQTVTLGEEPRTGYTFVGWKDGEKMYHAGETITVTGDMTLTAEWKKLPSAENLPKTGDESPVLLWGAALAVSAAACFVLRRKK